MSWAIGWDINWARQVGYSVPAICDHPDCSVEIDRGLSYVCGGEPFGGDDVCGLYFCAEHRGLGDPRCERCKIGVDPFNPKPDTLQWIFHVLHDRAWTQWRADNTVRVIQMRREYAQRLPVSDATVTEATTLSQDYACENCIGMIEHGCYCKAMGATAPGGYLSGDNVKSDVDGEAK